MTTIDQIKQELRDIIELSNKVTPRKWNADELVIYADSGEVAISATRERTVEEDRHNASFIAASRNLTPKMAKALLGNLEMLEHMTTYTTKAGTVAINALETICREWEVHA